MRGDVDQRGDEPVVALAVHGRREPHHHGAHVAVGQRQRHRGRLDAWVVGVGCLVLGEHLTDAEHARRDQQRTTGAGERVAEGFDRGLVHAHRLVVLREVVDVREVDHRVGAVGSGSEDLEVVELAPLHLGPDGGDRGGGGIGSRQADDVVTGSDELGDDRRPMNPEAPVTKTRMGSLLVWSDVRLCHHSAVMSGTAIG